VEAISLYELNLHIRSAIDRSFPGPQLITAEIASCDVKKHCYLTLVDKEDETVRAEIRANIWANRYKAISKIFEEATGTQISKGIKILFEAEINFHERYGLKLNILNIDPSYTIGEMAVKRKEVLERLSKDGLIKRNKELVFPLVPQRIGIISSSTAAGYEDLMTHLLNNPYGYKFRCRLYEAVMQGDNADTSVVNALNQCSSDASDLDIVVIVRGGGGQVDLHCFDSYDIGKSIALLTAKTPTAVADMIITHVKEFEDRLDVLAYNMVHGTHKLSTEMEGELSTLVKALEVATGNELLNNSHSLNLFVKGIKYSLKFLQNKRHQLKAGESNIHFLNPRNVLKRGYSITYNNGTAVRAISDIKQGDSLKTVLNDGEVTSRVEGKKKIRRKA
jgi:exodeoxyribonuclease VII large subunit